MRIEKRTLGLAALGLVSLSPALQAQTNVLNTALSSTTISGYVDTSAVWNPGTGNANPAPYAFNAGKQDGFNVDAIDIKISKSENETSWAAGYVAELSYGPDATGIDGGAAPIRQAYVELRAPLGNGIDFQFGRWDNLLGYESSDSYKNPNFTRSYGYSAEPTEHTGILATYKVNDEIQLQAGGTDSITTEGGSINARGNPGLPVVESKKGFVSLASFTAPTNWGSFSGSAFYAGFDIGEGVYGQDQREWYLGTTLNTPISNLTFGASWDGVEHLDVVGVGDAGWFTAYAGYVTYKVTDKLTLNGRAEYADGKSLGALSLADNGIPTTLDKVFALTATAQYDLWANVISRLELRWDHAANGAAAFGGTGGTGDSLGGSAPTKKNEVLIAANIIYKF